MSVSKAMEKAQSAIDWEGSLADGSLVSYMENKDVTRAALSIVPAGSSDAKTWIGDATKINEEGKVIITDDASKETVSFVVKGFTEDAVFSMDIEGFGKAALVPITEEDYKRIAEVRELLDK